MTPDYKKPLDWKQRILYILLFVEIRDAVRSAGHKTCTPATNEPAE